MSHAARPRLATLVLCLALGIPGAVGARAAGTAWTDPPAHAPEAAKPPPEARAPAPAVSPMSTASPTPAASPAPKAAVQVVEKPPRPARKAVAARPAPRRAVAVRPAAPARARVAATPRRVRVVAAPPVRMARPPRRVAAVPEAPRPYGYGPGYGLGFADERLERLRAAEAAGYLVVRRRTVEFPDGRFLRIYRPPGDGEPF